MTRVQAAIDHARTSSGGRAIKKLYLTNVRLSTDRESISGHTRPVNVLDKGEIKY